MVKGKLLSNISIKVEKICSFSTRIYNSLTTDSNIFSSNNHKCKKDIIVEVLANFESKFENIDIVSKSRLNSLLFVFTLRRVIDIKA